MNDLESWFEKRLGFLIEPEWPRLALPMIEALKTERNQLAQWLLKTAVMFSIASLKGEHQVEFTPAVTRKIKDGILPKDCRAEAQVQASRNQRMSILLRALTPQASHWTRPVY